MNFLFKSTNIGNNIFQLAKRMNSSSAISLDNYKFKTILVTNPYEYVFHVQFNRPEKRNSMNFQYFADVKQCFRQLHYEPNCRSIVVSGAGKSFTGGLDLSELSTKILNAGADGDDEGANCIGRKGFHIKKIIEDFQESLSSIENCPKPVISCVHGACIGGGIDLISSCDIRYCSKDAFFSIREVDIGLAADIGTLQRLPKIVGNHSLVRELVYTARDFYADEAKSFGLVSRVFDDQESLLEAGFELAKLIASKSPIAIQGSKINLNYSRDHSVEDGLKFVTAWNMCNLQSEDLIKAAMATMQKEKAIFSKL